MDISHARALLIRAYLAIPNGLVRAILRSGFSPCASPSSPPPTTLPGPGRLVAGEQVAEQALACEVQNLSKFCPIFVALCLTTLPGPGGLAPRDYFSVRILWPFFTDFLESADPNSHKPQ